ncbi:MAG: hypothetical protein Q9M22_03215 [Mariprofundaceae bacterium]|nr:hypothetical protein [Mariprofundaceae bacterium]
MLIQESFDRFKQTNHDAYQQETHDALELFGEYIVYYSDLSFDEEEEEPLQQEDWEQPLEQLMEELLEGDLDAVANLGILTLDQLNDEHLRDFLAWFLLREADTNSLTLQKYTNVLLAWVTFLRTQKAIDLATFSSYKATLEHTGVAAVRVCQAAHILFHFVRLGSAMSPRNREKKFTDFIEGHARIVGIEHNALHVGFDNQQQHIDPILLPEAIISLLQLGDVLDVELGLRNDEWQIVDAGPIYPACIYIEAECFDVPEKIIP